MCHVVRVPGRVTSRRRNLTNSPVSLLPPRPFCLNSSFFDQNLGQVQLSSSRSDIDFVDFLDGCFLNPLEWEVKCQYYRKRQVVVEPTFCTLCSRHAGVTNRGKSCPKRHHDDQDVENESSPRAPDSGLRLEGELIECVTCLFPGLSEADMTLHGIS